MYNWFLIVIAILAIVVLAAMLKSFTVFIDVTSVLAFVISPILAFLNHRAMWSLDVPDQFRPSRLMKFWSIGSILFLSSITLTFLYFRFFALA